MAGESLLKLTKEFLFFSAELIRGTGVLGQAPWEVALVSTVHCRHSGIPS